MSQQNQETVIGHSDYVPIENREPDYGKATEDRQAVDKHRDNQFTPILDPKPNAHPNDEQLEQLEQQIKQAKRDKAFGELSTFQERHAQILREQRERDFNKQDAQDEQRKHLQLLSPQLNALQELRKQMVEGEGFRVSQIVAIDKAIKQLSTVGASISKGMEMVEAIEADYEATLQAADDKLKAEMFGLQNKLAAVQALRKKNAEPEQKTDDSEDVLYKAARDEWEAARAAGNDREADRLRSVYFSARFARENRSK